MAVCNLSTDKVSKKTKNKEPSCWTEVCPAAETATCGFSLSTSSKAKSDLFKRGRSLRLRVDFRRLEAKVLSWSGAGQGGGESFSGLLWNRSHGDLGWSLLVLDDTVDVVHSWVEMSGSQHCFCCDFDMLRIVGGMGWSVRFLGFFCFFFLLTVYRI